MSQKYYAELRFTNIALKAEGQSYEDLFTSIMTKKISDFKKVRAYGNVGDRKNDGFVPSTGTYYQVFAPYDLKNSRTIVDAVSKLEDDFSGLLLNWNETTQVQKYRYVLNDKQNGCPPQVEQKIGQLKIAHPTITFETYTMDSLLKEFLELSTADQQTIIGFIPSPEQLRTVSIPTINQTIEHLKVSSKKREKAIEDLNKEEFDKKIEFNFLNRPIADLMEKAETQNYILEEYFTSNEDKKLKSSVRDMLNYMYQTEKEIYGTLNNITSPILFYSLLDKCSIDKTADSINATLVLLSYFFISCDIYEKPITNDTSI